MKFIFRFLLFIIIVGCGQNDSKKENEQTESNSTDSLLIITPYNKDSVNAKENKIVTSKDSVVTESPDLPESVKTSLLDLSTKILRSIKERRYNGLAQYVHPKLGVRFSLYAYIDTALNQILSGKKIIALGNNEKQILWGLDDGTEEEIKLSINNYFKRFVYDVDFLNAEKKAVNKFLGVGNSLNNLKEVYPSCNFTEFYFSGFDPKSGGSDWRALRLIFKTYNKKTYLVGIVHDEWTI